MAKNRDTSLGREAPPQAPITVGNWTLDLASHRLRRGADEHTLNPKELGVLLQLVEAAPALVTSRQLLDRVWPDVVVGDHVLHEVVSRLRRMFGDNPRQPDYIETLPRRGYRLIAGTATAPAPGQRPRLPQRLVLAAALLLVVGGAAVVLLWRSVPGHPADPGRHLAVLPFQVLSASPDPYLADGLALEIQNRLGRLPDLVVLSRASVARALEPGRDVPAVAAELGATHVIDGTLSFDNETLDVSVELIEAGSLRRLWQQRYQRSLSDVLTLQGDVALAVAEALGSRLSPATRERLVRPATSDLAAFRLFEQASPERLSVAHPPHNRIAIDLLRAAVQLDPNFAEALAWQAWREVWAVWNGESSRRAAAVALAEQALALAPHSGMSNYAMGRVHVMGNRVRLGVHFFRRAAELAPSQAALLGDLSLFEGLLGDLESSLAAALRLMVVEPNSLESWWTVGIALRRLGQHELAERWLQRSLATLPDARFARSRVDLALAWLATARGYRISETEYRALAPALAEMPQARSVLASQLLVAGHWELADEWLSPVAYDNPHLRSGMDDNPMARSVGTQLGFALLQQGDRNEALALLHNSLERAATYVDNGGERPGFPLEVAAIHAALDNQELAVAWLERAYEAGIREHAFLRIDPMFAAMTGRESFQAITDRMAQDVAAKLGNARELGLLDTVTPADRRAEPTAPASVPP